MVTSENARIPWTLRLLALSYYFAATPFFFYSKKRREDDYLGQHYRQATGIHFLLFLVLSVFAFVILGLSYALVFKRDLYEAAQIEGHFLNITRKLFLAWSVFWIYGTSLALLGSLREMPIVVNLGRRKRVAAVTLIALSLIYASLFAAAPFAVHAAALAREDEAPGDIYMIYEDLNKFPRWIFTLGFYRISLAAKERLGAGKVVVIKLSEEAIARALREGRLVFLATHGGEKGLLVNKEWVKPEDIQTMEVSQRLEFVYLTSCDSGAQKQAWEDAFAPAEVVTFDRLTAIVEHIWWLWFKGPEQLRQLSRLPRTQGDGIQKEGKTVSSSLRSARPCDPFTRI